MYCFKNNPLPLYINFSLLDRNGSSIRDVDAVARRMYYDSGGGDGKACFKLLKWFLKAQARRWGASVPEGFNADEWNALLDLDGSWEFERVETPMQRNCLDCGPFTLGFASYITKCIEEHFPFSQDDITAIRKRITYDLMYAMREL